ncbi:Nucleoid-associated protein [Porphyridium purpureum]|uniref:Nucleoid-associated protein n=1 Tax=Porphyridium purpureum TaxID=35688 RepID=A0A5J4Z411_PORPP|nr:Nucleoid-associated protein [Porphyridium purpureum]|eukprot:POR5998..scf208_2
MAFVSACGINAAALSARQSTLCSKPAAVRRASATLVMQDKKGGGLFGNFPGMGGGDSKPAGGGGNPFGGMGNIMEAMKTAKLFTEETKVMQDELKNRELEVTSKDGMVKMVITGQQVPVRCDISDELLQKGADAVSASVTEAMLEAYAQSKALMQKEFQQIAQKYNLPAGMAEGGMPQ